MRLEPFRIEHFYEINGREGEITEENKWLIAVQCEHGEAWTIMDDDKPVCAFGCTEFSGVGAVWMHVIHDPSPFIYRSIKRKLDCFKKQNTVRRFECVIARNKTVNHKFIHRLGFTVEGGVARKYFPDGQDGIRWQWVRE